MTDADELLRTLTTVQRALAFRPGRPQALSALTSAQLELVRVLRREPEAPVDAVAERLGTSAEAAEGLADELAARGIVSRRNGRLDLDDAARETFEAWHLSGAARVQEVLARLKPAERERLDDALPVLAALADALAE